MKGIKRWNFDKTAFHPTMSDIATPGAVYAAVDKLQGLELLCTSRFDTMQGGKPIYILAKGRHATTCDGRHVRIMVHEEMADFDQTTADEQQCLVQSYNDDGKPTAEPYLEQYGKLTLRLEPYEKNIIGLALVLGVLPIPGAPSTIAITQHVRREVLDLTCFQCHLTHLTDKSYEGMWGEKAYSIVIDMGKTRDSKLREMSQHFTRAMACGVDFEANWMDGAEMWARMAEKFQDGLSSTHRQELLSDLNRVVELRVVGKKNF